MQIQKYSVNQQSVSVLLAWVQSGEIAIPEIQRPFVWDASKVRDLMDSLYKWFPCGLPKCVFEMNIHYENFLGKRRKLMAAKINEYYFFL